EEGVSEPSFFGWRKRLQPARGRAGQRLKQRIADRSVLKLLRLWLQSPVIEKDDQGRPHGKRSTQGTPQGGVISPLLANIYLHWFEKSFHGPHGPARWASAKLVRYADDFGSTSGC